jgi:hypothetical protein
MDDYTTRQAYDFLIAAGDMPSDQELCRAHRNEFWAWVEMCAKCNDPQHPLYPAHGGAGVEVCPQWRGPTGFAQFLADMGPVPQK